MTIVIEFAPDEVIRDYVDCQRALSADERAELADALVEALGAAAEARGIPFIPAMRERCVASQWRGARMDAKREIIGAWCDEMEEGQAALGLVAFEVERAEELLDAIMDCALDATSDLREQLFALEQERADEEEVAP